MSSKQIRFARPARRTAEAEDWVKDRAQPAAPAEPMKRLTIDIPAPLHARVKAGCALRGVKMADLLRAYLEREFPES